MWDGPYAAATEISRRSTDGTPEISSPSPRLADPGGSQRPSLAQAGPTPKTACPGAPEAMRLGARRTIPEDLELRLRQRAPRGWI
jgi:hypothetical protein